MKIIFISIGVILIIFVVLQIFSVKAQRDIETYPFSIVKEYKDFEVRNYEAKLFTSIKLSSDKYEEASNKGFKILAGYIFGGNERNEKISMTSPVTISLEDSMRMMFMVPKNMKKEELPKPNQSEIEFLEVPSKKMAAITFGGWANDEKIEKYKKKLTEFLNAEGINFSNRFYFFGYNSPYEVFNRKNEVLVEIINNPANP
ncbi:MAG: soul heme-binding protein [Flavobacteriales bacterium]|nr:soul heme-binding protein [Flavobacteriales bacterium]|tara:strand:- start:2544 stop:3146 length:603 start_codon:yes stop_codon:yes gene_type:complete